MEGMRRIKSCPLDLSKERRLKSNLGSKGVVFVGAIFWVDGGRVF